MQADERVQRKREREKARHATMTQEQRDEKNKKRREKYHKKGRNFTSCWSRGPPYSNFPFLIFVLPFFSFM